MEGGGKEGEVVVGKEKEKEKQSSGSGEEEDVVDDGDGEGDDDGGGDGDGVVCEDHHRVVSSPPPPAAVVTKKKQKGAERADRVDLQSHWRGGLTRLQKLHASLVARLPESWPSHLRENYVGGVLRYLAGAWAGKAED